MDLGRKIYQLRKQNNITQEQLAKAVGVTTPAVCKWETGVSCPDITLLAPIARKLKVSIDELLSFQETLSAAEIKEITEELKKTARKSGLLAGMEISREYLRQYPNVDELKLEVSMLPIMMAHTAEEEFLQDENQYEKLMEESIALLEELTNSENDIIRMSATVCLASRYMEQKRLEEAETMLKKLPAQEFDARHIYPSLYLIKGEYDKVMECSQSNMLQDIQHLLIDIRGQHTVYLRNKNYEKAIKCAKDYLVLVQIAATTAMLGNELLVDTYLAMEQPETAIKYFLDYIEEIIHMNGKYNNAFYYSYIADKVVVASDDIEDDIRASLYKYIMFSGKYSTLLQSKQVSHKMEELKKKIGQA